MILESKQYIERSDTGNNYQFNNNENEDLRELNSNIETIIKESLDSPLKEMKIPILFHSELNPAECSPVHMTNKYSPNKSFRYNQILLQFEGEPMKTRKELITNHMRVKSEEISDPKPHYVSRRKLIRTGKMSRKNHRSYQKKKL